MDITWYGRSCFRMRDRNVAVVADPYTEDNGTKLPRLTADIVTVSHDHSDHNYTAAVRGEPFVLARPGEYEVGGLFVSGFGMWHDAEAGAKRGPNTVYTYDFPDARVCHLGDLGHAMTQEQLEAVGDVDVLLVPVGGYYTIDARQAVELISLLEPSVVIPMHYAPNPEAKPLDMVDVFMREMGLRAPDPQDSYAVTGRKFGEEMQVVLLRNRAI